MNSQLTARIDDNRQPRAMGVVSRRMEKNRTDAQIDSVDDMQELDRSTCQSQGGKKSEMKRRVEGRRINEPSSVRIVTGFCQSTMIRLSEQKKAHRIGSSGRVRGMEEKGKRERGIVIII